MKIHTVIIRSLFGLALVMFGLNPFLQFMPMTLLSIPVEEPNL